MTGPNDNPHDDGAWDDFAAPAETPQEHNADADRDALFEQEFDLLMKQRRLRP